MKVKSFCYGWVNGLQKTFEGLDNEVKNLGDIEIHNITDTLYPPTEREDGKIVRVIIYS